jgi:hypothetical protein
MPISRIHSGPLPTTALEMKSQQIAEAIRGLVTSEVASDDTRFSQTGKTVAIQTDSFSSSHTGGRHDGRGGLQFVQQLIQCLER